MDRRHSSGAAILSIVVAIVAAAGSIAPAQTPTRAFEAISIKRNPPRDALPIAAVRGDRFIAPSTTVRDLIRVANLVEDIQIDGGPGWVEAERFAIEATTGPGITADDARAMVRAMLADRFKLKTHTEKRDLQGFSLIAVRSNTSDRRPSGPDCAPLRSPAGIPTPPPPPPPPPGGQVLPLTAGTALSKCGAALGPFWFSARSISFEQFATLLSRTIRRPVVDRTNLTGPYDFDLTFQPESSTPFPVPAPADLPSIFTAVQEQLGLKLDPQRVPTDVIVIESVERPSEN
ncbi:MAG TPA: TIGR03435 family protein [Vicinamibacterales bacterium]